MSVTFNPNANWNSLVGEAMQGTTLSGVGGAQAVQGADGNLTVTFTGANGLSQTVTIAPPALDEATGTLTEEGLADLRAKLDGAFDALKAALERATTLSASDTAPATDAQKMLFDIYALMQLMLEIAQKERESARTQRQADLSREVAGIRCQAEQQRTAARNGLIMSCVFSAASICAQAGTFFASSAAQASAAKMANASGVDQAQQNLSLLSAKNGAETGANLTKAGKSMTPEQLQAAKANFAKSETAKATLDTAVEQRENALKAVGTSDEQLQALNTEVKTATDAGQFAASTPIGAKAGVSVRPMAARSVDSAPSSVARARALPWTSKVLSRPRTSIMGTMNLPARQRKPHSRSQVCSRMCFSRGRWYGGSSMMKWAGSPRKSVRFRTSPESVPISTPER